jgi:flagellar protein FliS
MLYDRLLLDLQRAETAQRLDNHYAASPHLLHAQEIVAELMNSLRPELWDGGPGLLALYTYVTNAMIVANTRRDIEKTRECIRLLEPLRAAWHQAALNVSASESPREARFVG